MKTMKVSVLEFDYHAEVLRNTCMILQESGLHLNIFTTKQIWKQVNLFHDNLPESIHLFLYDSKKGSLKKFLKYYNKTLNTSDILLFNTVASKYRLLKSLNFKPPIILRIHNSNAYFKKFRHSFKPRFSPFFLWKDLSHLVRQSLFKLDWYHRKKFLDEIEYFAFPSRTTASYAVKELSVSEERAIYLPFSCLSTDNAGSTGTPGNGITISIPGKVDQRNRNYEVVVDAFRKISKELANTGKRITLVFLGPARSAYGKKMVKMMKSIRKDHFEFVSFTEFVPQHLFQEYIDRTDFFIVPLNIKTRYTIYEEKYGFTKISGNINDVIKYKKPAIIYSGYPLDDSVRGVTGQFSDEWELSSIIMDWCEHQRYKKINFDEMAGDYHFKNIQKLYIETFEKIISDQEK